MYTRKDNKRGKYISKLNNGWIVLQMDDGTTKRYPPSMVTENKILPSEPKKEPTPEKEKEKPVVKHEELKVEDTATDVKSKPNLQTSVLVPEIKASNMDDCIELKFGFRVPRSWISLKLNDDSSKLQRLEDSEKKVATLVERLEKLEKRNEELERKLGLI